MTGFPLTPSERRQLQDFIRCAPSGRACCRAQALLWRDGGDPWTDIADRLGVSRQTLHNWARRFHERTDTTLGERLRDGPRSGRPPTVLGVIDPLIAGVIDQDPRGHGYHATIWTAPLLRYHLRAAHGTEVSERSVSRALARLGLRWKRPRYMLANRPDTWRQAKGG
jgi:transposase